MKNKIITTAPQKSAAGTNQSSTNDARQIAREIKVFATTRLALIQRRQFLREQLVSVDAALQAKPTISQRRTVQSRGYGDLTAAVKQVLTAGALTKREIVERLHAMHLLTEPDPLKVLDSVIYTHHFMRDGKLFSLAKPIA